MKCSIFTRNCCFHFPFEWILRWSHLTERRASQKWLMQDIRRIYCFDSHLLILFTPQCSLCLLRYFQNRSLNVVKTRMKMDKYNIEDLIGEGSFGRVFRATVKPTENVVAMKIISKVGQSAWNQNKLWSFVDFFRQTATKKTWKHFKVNARSSGAFRTQTLFECLKRSRLQMRLS